MYYPFPQECFSSGSSSSSGVEFLTCLCLKYVAVTDENVESILSNCPMLESLQVTRSPKLIDPKVAGSSLRLKHLAISACKSVQSIEISAPCLVSFEYSGDEVPLHVRHAPKLNDVFYCEPRDDGIQHAFSQLSNYLPQLVTLRLRLAIYEADLPPFPELTSLRYLTCEVSLHPGPKSLRRLRYLIVASPFLHKFQLEIFSFNEIKSKSRKLLRLEVHPNNNLKEVEIVGFLGQPFEVEFVTYLLKSAINLEKIVIDTSSFPNPPPTLLSEEVVETRRQMAEHLAHLLREIRPGAEFVLL